MRLPKLADGETDIVQTKKMMDLFLSAGMTCFDITCVYDGGDSERAAKAALVDRYPRAVRYVQPGADGGQPPFIG